MKETPWKILVVDDSPIIRKIIKSELCEGGYQVKEAENGNAALAGFADYLPDLITLDIEMPALDGFETFKKLRGLQRTGKTHNFKADQIPVIFVTGNDNIKDRNKGFQLGAADFINKPFAKGDLLTAINKILKPENRLRQLTALVVDDSRSSRTIVTSTLEREGVKVIESDNGLDAFEILAARKAEIDMVISDLTMPQLEGDALCRKIRTELFLTDLPFILLTGLSNQSRFLEIFKSGITDYIAKPFVREELLARITAHLDRAELNKNLRDTIEELEKMKVKAEQANRAKSDFIATISHEIRTPLNAVIGLTELALGSDQPANLKDYLEKIGDASRLLLTITNDILDFSKIEAGKLNLESAEFDPENVVSDIAGLIEEDCQKKGLSLEISIDPDVPQTLWGDHLRLEQILANLVNNAVKFTQQGGILLRLSVLNTDDEHMNLKFSVQDTGIGLDPSQTETIFDAFTQADGAASRKYSGTGLGLAICKRLVDLMKGKIWVESEPGKGSTFYFTAEFLFPSTGRKPSSPTAAKVKNAKDTGLSDLHTKRRETPQKPVYPQGRPSGLDAGDPAPTRQIVSQAIQQHPPAEEVWPERLNGINLEHGLKRIEGDHKLYKKILLQFADEFADVSARMRDIINRGDLAAAKRLAHSIKGASGNISANDLQAVSLKLETAFKSSDRGNFVQLLAEFDQSVHQVLDSIKQLDQHAAAQPEYPGDQPLDLEAITSIAIQLHRLLDKNDFVDDELFEALRRQIPAAQYERDLKILKHHLDNFDYPQALSSLGQLCGQIGVSLEETQHGKE